MSDSLIVFLVFVLSPDFSLCVEGDGHFAKPFAAAGRRFPGYSRRFKFRISWTRRSSVTLPSRKSIRCRDDLLRFLKFEFLGHPDLPIFGYFTESGNRSGVERTPGIRLLNSNFSGHRDLNDRDSLLYRDEPLTPPQQFYSAVGPPASHDIRGRYPGRKNWRGAPPTFRRRAR